MAHSGKYHREGWQEHKWERQALSGACAFVLMCVFLDVRVGPRVWADTDEVSEFKRILLYACVQAGREGWPGAG